MPLHQYFLLALIFAIFTTLGFGQQTQQPAPADQQDLAKRLANPLASLISFPFQSNFDFRMGTRGDGFRYTLNIQPIIPFALTKNWNIISRSIVPVIAQKDVVSPGSSQFGLGDVSQSLYLSPSKTEPFIWGIGPQLLVPTGTSNYFASRKFAIGPAFIILKQKSHWTVGALANHTWSVAGSPSHPAVNRTFLQPFVSYHTKKAWTLSLNTESSYDWNSDKRPWSVPVHATVAKLTRFTGRPVNMGVSLRCWAATTLNGPQGCGFRFVITPLFPKK
jgi:hypothetical protein